MTYDSDCMVMHVGCVNNNRKQETNIHNITEIFNNFNMLLCSYS